MTTPISKKTRFEVFKRDAFTCRYCGKRPPEVMLEADHVVPVCEGGDNGQANLVTACFACNRGKGGTSLDRCAPVVDELALLQGIQEAMERATIHTVSLHAAEAKREAERAVVNRAREWWVQDTGGEYGFQENSIVAFLNRGLSVETIEALMTKATAAYHGHHVSGLTGAWKYFCGACWIVIRQQEGTP